MLDSRHLTSVTRHLICLATVLAISAVYLKLISVNATTAALTFLMAVLLVATVWGLPEAVTTSIAGLLAFNFFFIPPVTTFSVEDPQNWVALFAFLITAITASQLSAMAKRRTIEAQRSRRETEQLYTLGRAILLDDDFDRILPHTVTVIGRIFEVDQVALYDKSDGTTYRHGAEESDALLRQVSESGMAFHDSAQRYSIAPLHMGGESMGSLAIRGETGATLPLVEAIANLIDIGLERARAIERAASAEAARRNEELRAAMLDALAHDLKTPLTVIKASVTSLISRYPRTEERKEELLSIVNQETDRLHRIVSDTIQMARIDAGKISLHPSPRPLHEIVTGVLAELKLGADRVRLDIPDGLPTLHVDADLIAQALKQLLDNADRYSPATSTIEVSARMIDDSLLVSVSDSGPGVTPDEQSRIFDKFYRGRHSERFPEGTGMGLSIAKGIIEAHGGKISVSSRPGGGSTFSLELPLDAEQVRHE